MITCGNVLNCEICPLDAHTLTTLLLAVSSSDCMTFNLCLNLICSMTSARRLPNFCSQTKTTQLKIITVALLRKTKHQAPPPHLIGRFNELKGVDLRWRVVATGQQSMKVGNGWRNRLLIHNIIQISTGQRNRYNSTNIIKNIFTKLRQLKKAKKTFYFSMEQFIEQNCKKKGLHVCFLCLIQYDIVNMELKQRKIVQFQLKKYAFLCSC